LVAIEAISVIFSPSRPNGDSDIMSRQQLLALIDEVLYLEPGTLTGSEDLKEFDMWDSQGILMFLSAADEKCGISVQPDDIASCKKVSDLVALVEK
jgi:acyl carrier protein